MNKPMCEQLAQSGDDGTDGNRTHDLSIASPTP